MAEDSFHYDAIISYSHEDPDNTWTRRRFVPALEAAGLKVCVDQRDFRLGELLLTKMARAIEQSRWTIAVLSPPIWRAPSPSSKMSGRSTSGRRCGNRD